MDTILKAGINIVFAIMLLLLCSPAATLSSQSHPCTEADAVAADESISLLRDWTEIYDFFKAFSHCDDGQIAEGYSDAVAETLANKWNQLYLLNSLVSSDKGFKDFVIQHIDETAGDKYLQKIINNGTYHCQNKFKLICKDIKNASTKALKKFSKSQEDSKKEESKYMESIFPPWWRALNNPVYPNKAEQELNE